MIRQRLTQRIISAARNRCRSNEVKQDIILPNLNSPPPSNPGNLPRSLSLGQAFGLAFGAILGAGWIVGVGQWLQQAGFSGAVVGLSGGAAIIALVALCYAEAGGLYPSSGGEVEYVERLFGVTAGYCAGWLLALTYICAAAFEAISIAWLCEAMWPHFRLGVAFRFLGESVGWLAIFVSALSVVLMGAINLRGGKILGRTQSTLTFALIGTALIFLSAALARGHAANLEPHFVVDSVGAPWPGIAAVLMTAPFWFSGFGVVSYSIGEIRSTTRLSLVAGVVVLAIVAALTFYVFMLFATALTLPRAQLLELDLPASKAFVVALGSIWLSRLVLLAGIIALLMALNALLYAASRVFLQLAQSGLLPRGLGDIHTKYGSPHRAVLLSTTLVGGAASLGRGATGSLIDVSAVSISVVYVLICAGIARLRFTSPDLVRPYRIPGGAAVPIIGSLLTMGMIVGSIVTVLNDHAALLFQCTVMLFWSAIGLALGYRARLRVARNAR